VDHFSVNGAGFQENFNEQGKQEDNRHFSLVVIGFTRVAWGCEACGQDIGGGKRAVLE